MKENPVLSKHAAEKRGSMGLLPAGEEPHGERKQWHSSYRWPDIRAALIIYAEIVLMCRDVLERHMGLTSVVDSN